MFNLVGSAFGWLFGGSSQADKTVNSITSGIDKLVYTDEEKAEAGQKGMQLFIEYQKATQPQNVARRLIALIITSLFALLVLIGVVAWPFNPEYSDYVFEILQGVVLPSFLVIVSFYFYKRIKAE